MPAPTTLTPGFWFRSEPRPAATAALHADAPAPTTLTPGYWFRSESRPAATAALQTDAPASITPDSGRTADGQHDRSAESMIRQHAAL